MRAKQNQQEKKRKQPNKAPRLTNINVSRKISLPATAKSDIRICTLQGQLQTEQGETPQVPILLDTGAGFDCISYEFFKTHLGHLSLYKSHNKFAFDASNREIKVERDCFADLYLIGPEGDLKISNMKFAVLCNLSQKVIIGCHTLGELELQVKPRHIRLNNMCFERLELPSSQILKKEYGLELELLQSIIIESPEGERVTICAYKPANHLGTKVKLGLYSINIGDVLSKKLGVPNELVNGHIHPPTLEIRSGELQPSWILSFHGAIEEIPVKILCAFTTGRPSKLSPALNNINQNETFSKFKEEYLQKMIANSILPREEIAGLIRKYKQVFACTDDDLGQYNQTVTLKLRDPTADPAYAKPRVVPYKLRPWLDSKLREMIDCGLIRLAFSSPVHLVKKKEKGKWRLTIDYRLLNQMLVQNRWPIPRISEVLEELSGSRYYSVCDAWSGFWQLPLDHQSQEMTSFAARGRSYAWKVLPMGLSVSPGIFQSVMMDILGDEINKTSLVYIDDVIVYTKTKEEHFAALERVFEKLLAVGIKLHPEKSSFGQKAVDFLGYTVSTEGYVPIHSKVQAILAIERPETKTALKSFIGSVGFYTTCLPMIQQIMGPLHAITGSKSKYEWTADQEEAFNEVKQILRFSGGRFSGGCNVNWTTWLF